MNSKKPRRTGLKPTLSFMKQLSAEIHDAHLKKLLPLKVLESLSTETSNPQSNFRNIPAFNQKFSEDEKLQLIATAGYFVSLLQNQEQKTNAAQTALSEIFEILIKVFGKSLCRPNTFGEFLSMILNTGVSYAGPEISQKVRSSIQILSIVLKLQCNPAQLESTHSRLNALSPEELSKATLAIAAALQQFFKSSDLKHHLANQSPDLLKIVTTGFTRVARSAGIVTDPLPVVSLQNHQSLALPKQLPLREFIQKYGTSFSDAWGQPAKALLSSIYASHLRDQREGALQAIVTAFSEKKCSPAMLKIIFGDSGRLEIAIDTYKKAQSSNNIKLMESYGKLVMNIVNESYFLDIEYKKAVLSWPKALERAKNIMELLNKMLEKGHVTVLMNTNFPPVAMTGIEAGKIWSARYNFCESYYGLFPATVLVIIELYKNIVVKLPEGGKFVDYPEGIRVVQKLKNVEGYLQLLINLCVSEDATGTIYRKYHPIPVALEKDWKNLLECWNMINEILQTLPKEIASWPMDVFVRSMRHLISEFVVPEYLTEYNRSLAEARDCYLDSLRREAETFKYLDRKTKDPEAYNALERAKASHRANLQRMEEEYADAQKAIIPVVHNLKELAKLHRANAPELEGNLQFNLRNQIAAKQADKEKQERQNNERRQNRADNSVLEVSRMVMEAPTEQVPCAAR